MIRYHSYKFWSLLYSVAVFLTAEHELEASRPCLLFQLGP